MKFLLKWSLRILLLVALLGAVEALLLRHPRAFFKWSVTVDEVELHSDTPFEEADGRRVLEWVKTRVSSSPLYTPGRRDAAFICNTRWRRLLFCAGNYKAGGLNYSPLTTNVFLSGAKVAENRLVSPSGTVVPGEMTLAYFIAHEIAHSLKMEKLGPLAYWRMPAWIREGYADLVARGSVFKRSKARTAFLADTKEMNWPAKAPYLRYNILLGFLLEQKGLSLEEAFRSDLTQQNVEQELRHWLSAQRPPISALK